MKLWWERWPGRLEYEINELKQAGIHCEIDNEYFNKGIVRLNLRHSVNGEEQDFIVIFPDVYPYMKFEVFAPNLTLEHHQNPFQKNLCMVGMATENWRTSDTVAKYITSRLPQVIQSGNSSNPSEVRDLEELQGEPISFYYTYIPNSIILVDSAWEIDPSISRGIFELGIDRSENFGMRGVVYSVKDQTGNILAETNPELKSLFPDRIHGRWTRCQKPIIENNPQQFFDYLITHDRTLANAQWQNLKKRKVIIFGILFPEEVAWRENKDSWLFLILDQGGKIKP